MSKDCCSGFNNKATKCGCGVPAALLRSWTQDNPGRRFLRCKFSNSDSVRGCGYFRWFDEEQLEWQKTTINQLMLEKKVLNNELTMIKCELAHLVEVNNKLKDANVLLRQINSYEDEVEVNEINNRKSSTTLMLKWVVVVSFLVILSTILLKL